MLQPDSFLPANLIIKVRTEQCPTDQLESPEQAGETKPQPLFLCVTPCLVRDPDPGQWWPWR